AGGDAGLAARGHVFLIGDRGALHGDAQATRIVRVDVVSGGGGPLDTGLEVGDEVDGLEPLGVDCEGGGTHVHGAALDRRDDLLEVRLTEVGLQTHHR